MDSRITILNGKVTIEDYRPEYDHLDVTGAEISFKAGSLEVYAQNNGLIAIETDDEAIRAMSPEQFHTDYLLASEFLDEFYSALNTVTIALWHEDFLPNVSRRGILQQSIDELTLLLNHVLFTDATYWYKVNEIVVALRKLANKKPAQRGYIYLLRAVVPDNYYKIGLSIDPVKRIESMGVLLPFPIKPLHQFPTNHRFRAEKQLHDKYANKRVNGEWFALSEQDVKDICAISHMDIEGVQV